MPDAIEKVTSLIPDLFFDLIARVLPGGTVLSYIVFVLKPEPLVAAHDKHSIWFLLAAGYIFGLMLTSVSLFLFDRIWSLVFRRSELPWDRTKLFVKMDRFLIADPNMGNRIWKNYAEMVLCESLFVGFGGVAIWELWRGGVNPLSVLFWICALAAIFVVLWVRLCLVRVREKSLPSALKVDLKDLGG